MLRFPAFTTLLNQERRSVPHPWSPILLLSLVISGLGCLLIPSAALAHHPLGGRLPANAFEGLMSGLAHPIIGPDHFAFVVAAGLLAALSRQGVMIPIAFVIAGLGGTGIHLHSLDLPASEIVISASVLVFGLLLTLKHSPNWQGVAGLAAIAGLFHGYAYGEAIVGAEMTPTGAYLIGFTVIQLVIAWGAGAIAHRILAQDRPMPELPLRFAGFVIFGMGVAFLSAIILG